MSKGCPPSSVTVRILPLRWKLSMKESVKSRASPSASPNPPRVLAPPAAMSGRSRGAASGEQHRPFIVEQALGIDLPALEIERQVRPKRYGVRESEHSERGSSAAEIDLCVVENGVAAAEVEGTFGNVDRMNRSN